PDHFALRMERMGFSRAQVVFLAALVAGLLSLWAFLVTQVTTHWALLIYAVACAYIGFLSLHLYHIDDSRPRARARMGACRAFHGLPIREIESAHDLFGGGKKRFARRPCRIDPTGRLYLRSHRTSAASPRSLWEKIYHGLIEGQSALSSAQFVD